MNDAPASDTESMVLDFPGWMGRQDQETRDTVQRHLNGVPEADRPAEQQRLGAMSAVADATGLDLPTVGQKWDTLRGGYAEQQGGDWLAAKDDEPKFFAKIKAQAAQQRDERWLINGTDTNDAAGQQSREASLSNFVFRGTVLGQNYGESFLAWQKANGADPKFRADRADFYQSQARAMGADVSSKLEPVLGLARGAFVSLTGDADLEKLSEDLSPKVAALSDGDRRQFLAAVRVLADAAPDKEKATFLDNLQKTLNRSALTAGRGVGDFFSFVSGANAVADATQSDLYVQPGTSAEIGKGQVEALRQHNLESDLRRIQEADYSPVRDVFPDGWKMAEHGAYMTASAPAYMATALLPVVGVPATFAMLASQGYEQERFRQLDAGRTDEQASQAAATIAPIAAIPETALMMTGTAGFAGRFPWLNRAMVALGDKAGGGVTGYIARMTGRSLFDVANMRTQELMMPIVESAANALDKDMPEVVWRNGQNGVLDGWWSKTGETFLSMLPFALIGAADDGSKRVESLNKASDTQLRAFGAKAGDITAFREAQSKGVASAADAAANLLRNRDANSEDAKAATAELIQTERERAASASVLNADAMKQAGVRRVMRDDQGWALVHENGDVSRVGSAQAAQSIVGDLRQASHQVEADSLVKLIEDWHSKTPEGTKRQTTLTGETVTTDGQKIFRSKNGNVIEEGMKPEHLAELQRQAAMDARATGSEDVLHIVNGSNVVEFGDKVASGVRELVQRLEINQSDSAAITFLHESVEADTRAGIESGAISWDGAQRAIADIAGAFDPSKARDGEERAFRERVQRVARGEASQTEVRETLTELSVADIIGRRRDGEAFPAGSVSAALDAAVTHAVDSKAAQEVGRIRAFLRAVRDKFRAIFGTVAAIKKARREGKTQDFDALIDKVLGRDKQTTHDDAAAKEAEGIAKTAGVEYKSPTAEEEAAGIAFSLKPTDKTTLEKVADEMGKSGHSRAWAELPLPESERRNLSALTGVDLSGYQRIADASALRHIENRHGESSNDPNPITHEDIARLPEIVTAPGATDLSPDSKNTTTIVSVRYLDGWYYHVEEARSGNKALALVSLWKEKGPAETSSAHKGMAPTSETLLREAESKLRQHLSNFKGGKAFRLSPVSSLDLIQKRIDAALSKDPQKRKELARAANEKLQKLRAGFIDRIPEKRSVAEMDNEQAMRQALRADALMQDGMSKLTAEAHAALDAGRRKLEDSPLVQGLLEEGKLMSKGEAAERLKYGEYDGAPWLPPSWYGGKIMPDGAAQMLHEKGLLREATPDALWHALASEIASARKHNEAFAEAFKAAADVERQARNTAREEAANWRTEADAQQAKDWSGKASLVRDLRTYNAVLSVLPPELRSKAGGFVKLASLGEKGRLKEIGARIEKIARLVEKFLQKENIADLDRLISRAEPTGGPGERAGGRITVEGHRIFAEVGAVRDLGEEEVQQRLAGIDDAINTEITKPKPDRKALVDLYEKRQILLAFGDFANKSAADGGASVRWLDQIYSEGRNAWRAIVEQREQDRATRREDAIAEVGGPGALKERQQAKAAEAGQLNKWGHFFGAAHQSWAQRLGSIFGQKSDTVKHYEGAVTKAFQGLTDRMIERRMQQRDFLLKLFGAKSWWRAQDELLKLQERAEKTGVMKLEGRTRETITLPVDKAQDIIDGKASAEAFGLRPEDLPALEVAVNDWASDPKNTAKSVSVETTSNAGKPVEQPLSQLEAVHLTMLAMQPKYREAMDKHGWTAESLAQMETFLSPEAKSIRQWLFDRYEKEYAGMNKVYQAMYGIDLPKVELYAPGYFERAGEATDLDPFGSGMDPQGMTAGFLRQRKNHSAEPVIMDALQTYWNHVKITEHWKALAPVAQELRSVLGAVDVRHAITAHEGEAAHRDLISWIEKFERGGVRDAQTNRWVGRVTTALTRAGLSLNVGTLLKHLPNAFASLAEVPAHDFMRGMVRVMTGRAEASLGQIWKSDAIRNRLLNSYTPDLRQIAQGANAATIGKTLLRIGDSLDWGVARIPFVAGAFTTFSAAVAHEYHFSEAIKAGMDHASALRYAEEKTALTIARTAQPETLDRKSLAELERTGAARLMMLFHTPERQQWGVAFSAVRDALTGKGSKADAARKIFSTWVVAPVLMQTMVGLWRYLITDEDAEEAWNWKRYAGAVAMGPVSGIFGLGQAVEALVHHATGAHGSKAGEIFSDMAEQAIRAGKHVTDGEATFRDTLELFAAAGMLTGMGTDIPTEGLKVFKRLFDATHGLTTDKTELHSEKHGHR